jgi:hypothetical protein
MSVLESIGFLEEEEYVHPIEQTEKKQSRDEILDQKEKKLREIALASLKKKKKDGVVYVRSVSNVDITS